MRFDPHFGRYVAGFQLADQLMDIHAIADFDGNPGQIGMRVVHGIAQLEGRYGVPAPLFKELAAIRRDADKCPETFRGNTISESTLTGPARLTGPCSITF